ncbi:MAG TPA: DegT/DnrJ/EryC1/StrS family aminotransferase [Kiritimatiellia bacterium]|nr:DegT/DnrJ/EryC1/StrS family aminotransferase [Kiritimatiellia bacterium]HRZ11682.1 DegT/DnrJ/EryC1/StrS family aminotransferase [Kiritimatiellia bacterium]HSA16767.1 DegT/DnrJ/EryC1/StrS family aminotransferase [Kiritimatiellia bacterium]
MTTTFKSKRYDLAVDTITEADIRELIDWLRAYPRLTMAHVTREFEKAWSEWLGVRYSVFCNSGSSANLLMYAALDSTGRSRNRGIVVPAVGWSTTVGPSLQLGWKPVMCEADPLRYSLDARALERLLREHRPDNVILVHVLGTPADMEPILALQEKYKFNLMEDCCAAHGARFRGRKVGTFGAMSSFSFFYGHHMSTIEGGMVSTNDEELYHHLLMLRSHGWCKDLPPEKYRELMAEHGVDSFHCPFTFILPGFNLRPLDLTARIGLSQLPRLDETVRRRAENHRRYQQRLEGAVEFARVGEADLISSISFGGVAASNAQRKVIVSALVKNEIDTRLFSAGNLGRHPFWTKRHGVFSAPVADRIHDGGFFLPNNQSLDAGDIDFVSDVVIKAVRG